METNKRILAILLSIWLLLPMSGMEILAQGLSDNSLENILSIMLCPIRRVFLRQDSCIRYI